jgi:hypothetical protein
MYCQACRQGHLLTLLFFFTKLPVLRLIFANCLRMLLMYRAGKTVEYSMYSLLKPKHYNESGIMRFRNLLASISEQLSIRASGLP